MPAEHGARNTVQQRPIRPVAYGKWHGRPARDSRARCACHIKI